MLGDCRTIIFLWYSLAVTPSRSRLDWGGTGTSIPYLADTHMKGIHHLLTQQGGTSCHVECVNSYAGLSLHMTGHLSQSDTPPCEACPPICL